MRRASALSKTWLCGCVLALLPARYAGAAVFQVDMRALSNADVVVNNGSGTLDPTQEPIDLGLMSSDNFALATESASLELAAAGETPNGLPDDGFFAAAALHPAVRLGFDNTDDGVNAWRWRARPAPSRSICRRGSTPRCTSTLPAATPPRTSWCSWCTRTSRPTAFRRWSRTGSTTPADTPESYHLVDGLDRVQPGSGPGIVFDYEDSNDPAIFGLRFDPDPARVLVGLKLDRTDSTGVLNVFGVTLVSAGANTVTIYEWGDPANVVDPAHVFASNVSSPWEQAPGSGQQLYYRVEDGQRALFELLMVRSAGGLSFGF